MKCGGNVTDFKRGCWVLIENCIISTTQLMSGAEKRIQSFLILGILLSLNKLSPFFLNINLSEVMTVIPWNSGTIQC